MHTLTIWRITSLFFSGTLFQPRCERGANIPSRANVPRKEDNVAASFPIGKPEVFSETGMRMPLGMVHNFRHSVEPRGRLPIWKGGIRNLIKLCTYLSGITHKLNQHCSWIAQITVTGCDNEIKKCPDSRLIVKPNNKRELRPSQSALYIRSSNLMPPMLDWENPVQTLMFRNRFAMLGQSKLTKSCSHETNLGKT